MLKYLISGGVFVVLAAVIAVGFGDRLIAGYNTANNKEREKYRIGRLRGIVAVLCLFCGAVVIVDGFCDLDELVIGLSVSLSAIAAMVLGNTWAKKS